MLIWFKIKQIQFGLLQNTGLTLALAYISSTKLENQTIFVQIINYKIHCT